MTPPVVSIIIVNYRTPRQIRLCLRSLRRFTDGPEHEVLVVDNGGCEDSRRYLEGLPWITLLANTAPAPSHKNALDLARAQARGEWLLIMHSDAFVRRRGWLEALLSHAGPETQIIASADRVLMPLRSPLDRLSLWWTRRKRTRRWRRRGLAPKMMSHCALFRRELFERERLRFDEPDFIDGVYIDCAEPIQRRCEQRGLEICWLDREQLGPLLWHFEAATLNLVTGRKVPFKRRLRAWRFYRRPEIRDLLEDQSLDR